MSGETAQNQKTAGRKRKYRQDGTPIWSKRTIDGPGVWVTCIKGKEKQTVGELYDLFDAIANELWPETSNAVSDQDDSDDQGNDSSSKAGVGKEGLSIEEQIAKEIDGMKKSRQGAGKDHRFANCLTNTACVVFISCKPPVDPVKLVLTHFERVQKTGLSRTRFTQRMVPSSGTCVANLPEVTALCNRIIVPFFSSQLPTGTPQPAVGGEGEPATGAAEGAVTANPRSRTYKIEIRIRNHTTFTRTQFIDDIARCIPPEYKVDLANPDIFILVEVFKSICSMTVVREYHRYQKFNVVALAKSHDATQEIESGRIQGPSLKANLPEVTAVNIPDDDMGDDAASKKRRKLDLDGPVTADPTQ